MEYVGNYLIFKGSHDTHFIRKHNGDQLCEQIKDLATAKLLATCHGVCSELNPSNPQAVADGIKGVVGALVIARGLLVALDTKATNEIADICGEALASIKKEVNDGK